MNGKDLLVGLSYIDGKLVAEAEEDALAEERSRKQTVSGRRTVKKAFLIAAVIAVMLLLVGCTVVYVLSLQDMKVGEYTYEEPAFTDPNGETVPATEKTTALVSLQGVHQAALAEWLEFRGNYDQDGALSIANNQNESGIPEPYNGTYGCYTWEMVDKLDEITAKYALTLLEDEMVVQSNEYQVLFDALKISGLYHEDAQAQVGYSSGYFYPVGTFAMGTDITLTDGDWPYVNYASIRYSVKECFDPVPGSVGDISSYEQWNYTCKDGTVVLLAMNSKDAHIYADLDNAFVSIQMNAYADDGETRVEMPKSALEKIADAFDFSIQPQKTDKAEVERLLTEAEAARKAEETAQRESLYSSGYAAYIHQVSEKEVAEYMKYSLYDLNGDGTDELILSCFGAYYDVLSIKDGESYQYLYIDGFKMPSVTVYPCEGNVIGLQTVSWGEVEHPSPSYYFLAAGEEDTSFIVGVYNYYDGNKDNWYLMSDYPNPDPKAAIKQGKPITEEEARAIIDSYPRIELDLKPISEYPQ